MPISPAYTWSETDTLVHVFAQCKGVSVSTTDVYCSPHYVSVNASPYFLELDLCGQIDASRSVGTVRKGEVELKLVKAHPGKAWGRLLIDLPRPERLRRREASKAAAMAETEANLERKKKKLWDDSRHTLTKQMDLDRGERERIEKLKRDELAAEAVEIDKFTETTNKFEAQLAANGSKKGSKKAGHVSFGGSTDSPKPLPSRSSPATAELERRAMIEEVPDLLEGDEAIARQSADIFEEDDVVAEDGTRAPSSTSGGTIAASPHAPPTAKAAAEKTSTLPPPRSTTKVTIKFTKLLLSAPARTKGDLANADLPLDPIAAPNLRTAVADQTDISQRDPAWLKDRGDRYLRLRDFRSAESAYSLSLNHFKDKIMGQAIDCVVACWSNRAICHLHKATLDGYLAAIRDCTDGLSLMSKARCVTEYPKTESQISRCRVRLLSRRAAAYGRAGVLHRAFADLHQAIDLVTEDVANPSSASDRQMLQSDLQRVRERQHAVSELLKQADEILAAQQPAVSVATGESDCSAELGRARALYNEALELQPLEVSGLTNRAAALLWLKEPYSCKLDCDAALLELDREEARRKADADVLLGMFPAKALTPEQAAPIEHVGATAATLRFEALRRRAAAAIELDQLPAAAADLKACLKLRPGDVQICHTLDDLARRAAEAGVELEPLPPSLPEEPRAEEKQEDHGQTDAELEAEREEADGGAGDAPQKEGAPRPPVGTRTAQQIKADADAAFKEARLGRAISLYGRALKVDAAAEWIEGSATGGLLFRCQCLANRSACHLKMREFSSTVDDATAALTALTVVPETEQGEVRTLTLKLLARRGVAFCQLTKYEDARADYARAVELDPGSEQLKRDLVMIEQQCN